MPRCVSALSVNLFLWSSALETLRSLPGVRKRQKQMPRFAQHDTSLWHFNQSDEESEYLQN
jgi:hypothetical protein